MNNKKVHNENIENAKKEFMQIINDFISPLIDIKGNFRLVNKSYKNRRIVEIEENDSKRKIRLFPTSNIEACYTPFYIEAILNTSVSISGKTEVILRELLKVAEYNYYTFSTRHDYGKGDKRRETYKVRTLNLAFELGICKWLTNTENDAVVLHTVISHMITWSSKTYEGNRIPFGIVIDFNRKSENDAADYLQFLKHDSCAVFTDGIFSGILLDKRGKVLSFITKNSKVVNDLDNHKKVFVPYQFEEIAKHCVGSSVGVIALTGGEIIIVKDQSIQFARRGGKWISFDFERVYHNLRPYFLETENNEDLILFKIREFYCTLLDVSFAHSGGCIAIITPDKDTQVSKITEERIDLYSVERNINVFKNVSSESKEKIIILSYLLSSDTGLCSFFEVDRILRKEILGLDGATVVSLDGSFYCAGSIVEVSSGSSGGGRTAAAKKLANFGVGIKISEDGYIEAYGTNLNNRKDSRIVKLFSFK